jgi:hypothetical protein
MLDGFTKRDFAIFAAALGVLTVGVVDFVIYHYVFQDTNVGPHSREINRNDPAALGVGFPVRKDR